MTAAYELRPSRPEPVDFLRSSRAYARRFGLAVFPLRERGKEPLTAHGYLDASRDKATITAWAGQWPHANIGIPMGPNALVAVDIDPRNRGDDSLALIIRRHGALPPTWTNMTGSGGYHYLFKDPGGVRFRGSLGPGIDVKHLGYIVAPPSLHPNGLPYKWDCGVHPVETEIAPMPAWLLELATERCEAPPLPSSGCDARVSLLGCVFEELGWLGDALPDGRRMVRCPWFGEHTDGRGDGHDTSTVLFPRAVDSIVGGWACSHGHCASRSWRDVLDVVPSTVRNAATAKLAAHLRQEAA